MSGENESKQTRTGRSGSRAAILSDVDRKGEELLQQRVKCLVDFVSMADIKRKKNKLFFIQEHH